MVPDSKKLIKFYFRKGLLLSKLKMHAKALETLNQAKACIEENIDNFGTDLEVFDQIS